MGHNDSWTGAEHVRKGNLLEQVVAALHTQRGVEIEQKAMLPTLRNPDHKREIDVLIKGSVAGYPAYVAIECKNYQDPITPGNIDEFRGKLESVGIPPEHGIYVTTSRFTPQAEETARGYGIRPFIFEGLSADRLESQVLEAFQSVVLLLLTVHSFTIQTSKGDIDPGDLLSVYGVDGSLLCYVPDLIWDLWRTGDISSDFGVRDVPVSLPDGAHFRIGDDVFEGSVTARLQVLGVVVSEQGNATRHVLRDPGTAEPAKVRISSNFTEPAESLPVTVVETEEDLRTAIHGSGVVSIGLGRRRLPRILLLSKCYWPPSDRAVRSWAATAHKDVLSGDFSLSSLERLGYLDVEGSAINRVFDPIMASHPASRDPAWLTRSLAEASRRSLIVSPRVRSPRFSR